MRVLITGITGFVGSHLAEFLVEKGGIEVHGLERWRSKTDNIEHLRGRFKLHFCDIRDASSVYDLLAKVRPDRIFHLAAQSYVLVSWQAPTDTLTTNIIGQLNLFEAVRALGLKTRIQIAGSSEEYGLVAKKDLPIKETTPLNPLSPYAVSKVGQDLMAYQYYRSYNLFVVRTRAFNHTGPRRGDVFVESNFAKQLAQIESGKKEPVLYVGNLESIRDYTDVRDVVRAYWLSLEKCKAGEVYNIASGDGYRIKEVLRILLSFSSAKVKIEEDPSRMRPSDVPVLLGDSRRFRRVTGWKNEIPFEKTLQDLLNYWRDKIA